MGFAWDLPSNDDAKRRGRKRKGELSDEFNDFRYDNHEASDAATIFDSRELKSLFESNLDPFFTGDQSNLPQWTYEGENEENSLHEQKKDIKYMKKKSFNETIADMAEVAMSIGIMDRWT